MIVVFPYYKKFYETLNKHDVQYLCVGGFAVTLWGYTRGTNDFDLWVNPEPTNTMKLLLAIEEFGFPIDKLKGVRFDETSHPIRLIEDEFIIEILHTVWYKPLTFESAYSRQRILGSPEFRIATIYLDDLIDVKKNSTRPKDKEDVKFLEIIKDKYKKDNKAY